MFFKKIFCFLLLCFFLSEEISAQNDRAIFASYTTANERQRLYTYILNSINNNLLYPLIGSEDKWEEAVTNIELIGYKNPFVNKRIHDAFDSIQILGYDLKRSLLELAYSMYQKDFNKEVINLIVQSSMPKIFAMCAEYLLQNIPDKYQDKKTVSFINELLNKNFKNIQDNAI
jgi:hypothetical protein